MRRRRGDPRPFCQRWPPQRRGVQRTGGKGPRRRWSSYREALGAGIHSDPHFTVHTLIAAVSAGFREPAAAHCLSQGASGGSSVARVSNPSVSVGGGRPSSRSTMCAAGLANWSWRCMISPEPRAQSPEPRAQSPEPRAQSPEPRAQSPEPRAQSPEPRAQSPEPRSGARSGRCVAVCDTPGMWGGLVVRGGGCVK